MSDQETIKKAHERNKKLLTIKPSKGQYTTTTNVRLYDGTSCEVTHGPWTFTSDIGETEGGNNAGPGPSVLERAALGSCLAIGYSKYAALSGISIEELRVEVEAEVDVRGSFGIDGVDPGYKGLRYRVYIESTASEEEIREVVETADRHSPVLKNMVTPVPVERHLTVIDHEKKGELEG